MNDILTPRQFEVMLMTARGQGLREIARDLGISPHTVSNHRREALRKMDKPNVSSAAATFGAHHPELVA